MGFELKPLGWITIGFIAIGLILYIYLQFFTEMTVHGKAWFVLSIGGWGAVSVLLTAWSFLDYYK